MKKSFSEAIQISDFKDRFDYLSLHGKVSEETFGFDRYLNQNFYRSSEWKSLRQAVTVRDDGFDIAHRDFPISGRIIIHHINPLLPDDIKHSSDTLFDMDNLISVSHLTHNAIHYGDFSLINRDPIVRAPGDTKLW